MNISGKIIFCELKSLFIFKSFSGLQNSRERGKKPEVFSFIVPLGTSPYNSHLFHTKNIDTEINPPENQPLSTEKSSINRSVN